MSLSPAPMTVTGTTFGSTTGAVYTYPAWAILPGCSADGEPATITVKTRAYAGDRLYSHVTLLADSAVVAYAAAPAAVHTCEYLPPAPRRAV